MNKCVIYILVVTISNKKGYNKIVLKFCFDFDQSDNLKNCMTPNRDYKLNA